MSANRFSRDFAQQPHRSRRGRHGSVLILVVALLVLMALVGMAYLTVAHESRISSGQHQFNTQVDLLVEGMEQVGQRMLRDDLFPPHYPEYTHDRDNPLLWTGVGETYPWPDYTSVWDDNSGDSWLADRLPSVPNLRLPAGGANLPYWRFITSPPTDGGPNVSDNGYAQPTDVLPLIGDKSFHTPYWPLTHPVTLTQRSFVAPTSVTVDGVRYPALQPVNSTGVPTGAAVLAADADGDGIADAGLLKLPVPAIGGVTWYGALRIIDNCAAINASVAWEPNPIVDPSQGLPGDFFPTNIDLAGAVLDPSEMAKLNGFRFGAASASLQPIDDAGKSRTDFRFISPYDALWMQMGRRLGNPGFNAPGSKYQPMPFAESIDLASRFCIHPAGTSLLDRLFPQSLGSSGTHSRDGPYLPDDVNTWFNDNFAFAADGRPNMPLRSILTTQNPVNDWAGDNIMAGAFNPFGPPVRFYHKISVNTAGFDLLRRGYDAAGAGGVISAFPRVVGTHGPAGGLAAINTIALRTPGLDVLSHRSSDWGLYYGPSAPTTVFGIKRQPFITEVYATNVGDGGGYVAIELHNPYPEPISMKNYRLVVEIHHPLTPKTPLTIEAVPFAPGEDWAVNPPTIPPHGYVVVASSNTVPSWVTAGPTGPVYVVQSLAQEALGNELFLLRPRRADGTLGQSSDAKDTYDEHDFTQLVPVDTYDFQGLWVNAASNPAPPAEWHYIRPSDVSAGKAWHFVYPGPYVPGNLDAKGHLPPMPGYTGTRVLVTGSITSLVSLGLADASVANPDLTADRAGRPNGYVDRPIRWAAPGFPGPNAVDAGKNSFPFGGFARNGDILQVPFIAAFTSIQNGLPSIYPISKVAALVEDQDYADDSDSPDPRVGTAVEDVGRFCPIDPSELSATHLAAASPKGWRIPNDLFANALGPGSTHYPFAIRLFDYLTVWSPASDYLPEADPQGYGAVSIPPQQVGNENPLPATPPTTFQPYAPIEGLINVNTAPWRVLAAVPWMPGKLGSGQILSLTDRRKMNAIIAQAIVHYRDYDDGVIHADGKKRGHGPFHSLFQLNIVPIPIAGTPVLFRDLMGHWANYEFDVAQGNLAAMPGKSNVKGDFAAKFLMMTRVSNLLTIRSDSFTVYIIVQGWRGAETAHPKLVAQRRSAFVVNRASLGSIDGSMGIMHVPVD
jgi:hypothetical protein